MVHANINHKSRSLLIFGKMSLIRKQNKKSSDGVWQRSLTCGKQKRPENWFSDPKETRFYSSKKMQIAFKP